jgi:helicase
VTGRPRHCQLDAAEYHTLLTERATSATINLHSNRTNATAPEGSVLATWIGRQYRTTPMLQGKASVPDDENNGLDRNAAIFTRRGDYRATGWLRTYTH